MNTYLVISDQLSIRMWAEVWHRIEVLVSDQVDVVVRDRMCNMVRVGIWNRVNKEVSVLVGRKLVEGFKLSTELL